MNPPNTKFSRAVDSLSRIQREYEGRTMPSKVGQALEEGLAALEDLGQEVADPGTRPAGAKAERFDGQTPGRSFATSDALKAYLEAGSPRGPSGKARVPSLAMETKAVPTIGSGVVEPSRIADVPRTSGTDRIALRQAFPTIPTTSNSVEYLRITSAQPETAAPVAESGLKPESTMSIDTATAPVRTLAAWMPITEQQLADIPQLQQLVDDELRLDLARLLEYQLVWGDGTGENLLALMNVSGVDAARSVAGDTVLDRIRRAATDIAAAGLEPNVVALHPTDYESLVLEKGSDDHYLFLDFPSRGGRFPVWGMQVVESVALEAYRSGDTTPQRVIIVGDFPRGATIFDRQQATIEVGFINDQFVRNQRTVRGEERVGFGVRRSFAFRYIETVAAVA